MTTTTLPGIFVRCPRAFNAAATAQTFYYMFWCRSLHCSDKNYVIYDVEGAPEGQYDCRQGPIWIHMRPEMSSRERAVVGFAPRAVSARLITHFVSIFSKTSYTNECILLKAKQRVCYPYYLTKLLDSHIKYFYNIYRPARDFNTY